ncbi:TLC domain-containing protein 4-B-like isoform X1 [Branchiostoma lanceolatum]|uniref:TLC domain-containing protein 4-B-like isoform X1 n=1 Tax=Branchiostoma lanceolatum TaxID=7740 RepID=UPI003455A0D7
MILQMMYVITVTVTALTLGIICLLVAPRLLRRFVPKYAELPIGTRVEFDTRVMSVCHSTVVGLISICAALVDHSIKPDVIRYDSFLVKLNCAIVVGYMCIDTLLLCLFWKHKGSVLFLFHHIVATWVLWTFLVYNNLPYFANSLLIMEVANPFMHLRWMMGRLGTSKTSLIYVVNQLTVTVIFLLFRIVNAVLYWKGTCIILQKEEYYGLELTTIFGHLFGGLIFHLMNIYWFWKIWKGTVKMAKIFLDVPKKLI